MTTIYSFMSQRQTSTIPSQSEPNPKKKDVSAVMTGSKRVEEDSNKNKGSSLKATNDVLTEDDQAPKKIEIPTGENQVHDKEGNSDISLGKYTLFSKSQE